MVGRAEVLPPDVAALQHKLAEAEDSLAKVRGRMEDVQQHNAKLDGQLQAMVKMALRAHGYPPSFWLWRNVAAGEPAAGGVVGHAVAMNSDMLQRDIKAAHALSEVYRDVNTRLDAVRGVAKAYDDARGRLLVQEKVMLRRSGARADDLAAVLQQALDGKMEDNAKAPLDVALAALPAPDHGRAAWPVVGRVVRPYHSGSGAMAEGVVLKAEAGTHVNAPLAGKVLYAGPFKQFGGLVIVKSDDGRDVLLAGLGALMVRAGDAVEKAQVVGALDERGRLYWEVRRRGRQMDPLGLLR